MVLTQKPDKRSSKLPQLNGMRIALNETMTDLTSSWNIGLSRTTWTEPGDVQLLPDVELL